MPDPLADRLADPQRLQALRRTALLDSAAEEAFDRLTRLATSILRAPIGLVTLVEQDRQFFKSFVGLPEPWASLRQTPMSYSFCQHTVASCSPLIVSDARYHPLVADSPAIRDLNVIAYAGIPLITHDGYALGSFCVIDSRPRYWSDEQIAILQDLALAAVSEIEVRLAQADADAAQRDRDQIIATLTTRLRAPLATLADEIDDAALQAQAQQLVEQIDAIVREHRPDDDPV